MAVVRKVLIVGGGPAGLCAATVLARSGIDVEIAEINPDLRPLGVGIAVSGASVRALAMVDPDLLHQCVTEGAAHRALTFATADGQIAQRVELRQLAGPQFPGGFGIMRPVLWGVLAAAAQQAGAKIRLSVTVTQIRQEPDGVEVLFSDGSVVSCDLLIGADGLWSKVRELVFGDEPTPSFTGQTAWRVMVPRAPEVDEGIIIYAGPRGRVGCNPVSADEMYVFVLENSTQPSRPPQEEWLAMVRGMFAGYGPVVERARGQIADLSQIDRRSLHSVLVRQPWNRGRVLLIGDAAHAPTPHLGMGAGIAFEDAVVLGEVLGSDAGPEGVDGALERFMERRYERCRLVVENSLQLGEWDKNPGDPLADPAGLSDASFAALAAPF